MSKKVSACDRIQTDLLASAIGEAESQAVRRVQEHVDRCSPCRGEFEHYRAIDGEVAAMRRHPLAPASAARARERLETSLLDLRSRLVAYRIFPSPFGPILIARSEQGVMLVDYLDSGEGLAGSRLSHAKGIEPVEDGAEIEALYRELRAYIEGRSSRLGWPLDLRLVRSEFHRDVLRATAVIPYGAVVSYKRLAREVGRPDAVRAVAQALRWNPIPIAIPCHRVIGTSGALTGYAGGETSRKRQLLSVEGLPMVKTHGDFQVVRNATYMLAPGESEYCLPSCPSPDALRSGLLTLFGSRERAEAAGLVPCTLCRPDLHPLAAPASNA